jgi:hypothetical protein
MTMIARCRVRDHDVVWSGFVPCIISPEGHPTPLPADSAEGQKVAQFVQDSCDDIDLGVSLKGDPTELGELRAVRVS